MVFVDLQVNVALVHATKGGSNYDVDAVVTDVTFSRIQGEPRTDAPPRRLRWQWLVEHA